MEKEQKDMERGRGGGASRCAQAADPGVRARAAVQHLQRQQVGEGRGEGARRKGGLNEGWLWGGYSHVQGVGRPCEGRAGRRRAHLCRSAP